MSIPHLILRGIILVLLVYAAPGTAALAGADDDLLDPSQIGAAKRAQAAEDLLDPTTLHASRDLRPETATAATTSPLNGLTAGYTRSLAESTVRELDNLTRIVAEREVQIEKLDSDALSLAAKLDRLTREKAEIMEEYRNGLFCSGCNKTKAQILAEGDQFPHPGQHIIQPTQDQIDAKERELQAPIDQTGRELTDTRAHKDTLRAELDEAGEQSIQGVAYWATCISLEHAAIAAAESKQRERFQTENARIEEQLQRLAAAELPQGDPVQLAAFRRECDLWLDLHERLEAKHADERQATRVAYVQAGRAARDECARLNAFTHRGAHSFLPRAYLNVVVRIVSSSTNRDLLGWFFRMGDHNPARHGQTVASVRDLIERFVQVPAAVFLDIDSSAGANTAVDRTTEDLLSAAARLLRETVRNRLPPPESGEQERTPTTGTGVRG